MKKKISTGIIILASISFLSGCGETIINKTVESQTGGKVNIDASKGEMNIKTDDGEVSLSGEGLATLNPNFPKDIFIASDAKIQLSTVSEKSGSYSVAYITEMKVDEIYAKYKEDLGEKGWVADSQTEINSVDLKTTIFKKGAKRLTVMIGLSQDEQWKGKTSVQVIGATDKSVN